MTSSEQYADMASQLRRMADQSADLWKQGAAALTKQAETLSQLPPIDPAAGLSRYFELLHQAVEVNRELAGSWAAAVTSMSDAFAASAPVAAAGSNATSEADAAAPKADAAASAADAAASETNAAGSEPDAAEAAVEVAEQAAAVQQVAAEQAVVVEQESVAPESVAKESVAKESVAEQDSVAEQGSGATPKPKAPRAAARDARVKAKAPYEGKTKAQLSGMLVDRGLPKSGTLAELINRLVADDEHTASAGS